MGATGKLQIHLPNDKRDCGKKQNSRSPAQQLARQATVALVECRTVMSDQKRDEKEGEAGHGREQQPGGSALQMMTAALAGQIQIIDPEAVDSVGDQTRSDDEAYQP